MIIIATQSINTNGGKITIELLKHDILDKFFVYSSNHEGLAVTDMANAEQALLVYNSYARNALNELVAS